MVVIVGTRDTVPCWKQAMNAQNKPLQTSPVTVQETDTSTETSPDRLWNVVVWNDPINLMSYVTFVFQKLFGYSLQVATRHMLEVHNQGRSIVASAEREKAEYYVTRLHQYGLAA